MDYRILYTIVLLLYVVECFNLGDYSHYIDYIPAIQEGYLFTNFNDFKTSRTPPSSLRNRKMKSNLKLSIEEVLKNPLWPSTWPYGFEDFRPADYNKDEVINTVVEYKASASLLRAENWIAVVGLLKVPIRRHFIYTKDKIALADHMAQYGFFPGAKVLEIGSCYESILPPGIEPGLTVGVGWDSEEMGVNADLDDFIEQDWTTDPFLPLADNYFDFVIMPANFQLLQRPLDFFREVNRVLKPGGTTFVGIKLVFWSFLWMKQSRYFFETSHLEDVLALGSFFHYAEGFSKPECFDLNYPEVNAVGRLKDVLFPSPRLDFYACVQAKKLLDSPHGKNTVREPEGSTNPILGKEFMPKDDRDGSYY